MLRKGGAAMNKNEEKLYELIGNQMQEMPRADQEEIDRVYAKTMAKLKIEDKNKKTKINKRKYPVLLIAAAILLMNVSIWAISGKVFQDFNYLFTRHHDEEKGSNDKQEAFSEEDEKLMEQMGKIVNQKVSNGLDVTLTKVIGDTNNLYIIFEVEDPTGTIDFTEFEDKPMLFYDSCIFFPEIGGESGGWCEEIIEKRTPQKAQFMMECSTKDMLKNKKVSIILKDLIAQFDEDITPLMADEKDLTQIYSVLGSDEEWIDRKMEGKLENVIEVLDGSRLEQITMSGKYITFYFDAPNRTNDIYLIDSIALRNKKTGEIKAPSDKGTMKCADQNSKNSGKIFRFEGIKEETLNEWELVTGYQGYSKLISPGGWHFSLEVDFVDHTKSYLVDEILELERHEKTFRYHITEVNLSGASVTLTGTNLGDETLFGFEGKLVMKSGEEVTFNMNRGYGGKEIHLSTTLPYLINVEEVKEVVFEGGLCIDVGEASK